MLAWRTFLDLCTKSEGEQCQKQYGWEKIGEERSLLKLSFSDVSHLIFFQGQRSPREKRQCCRKCEEKISNVIVIIYVGKMGYTSEGYAILPEAGAPCKAIEETCATAV